MKAFEHEWILEAFVEHRSFFTRGMFGGLAAYLFERQMLLLVEPTKSGRWKWHGVRSVRTTNTTPPFKPSSRR